jgi:hypothetical protein
MPYMIILLDMRCVCWSYERWRGGIRSVPTSGGLEILSSRRQQLFLK